MLEEFLILFPLRIPSKILPLHTLLNVLDRSTKFLVAGFISILPPELPFSDILPFDYGRSTVFAGPGTEHSDLGAVLRGMGEDVAPAGFTGVVELLLALGTGDGETHDVTFGSTTVDNDVTTLLQRGEDQTRPVIRLGSQPLAHILLLFKSTQSRRRILSVVRRCKTQLLLSLMQRQLPRRTLLLQLPRQRPSANLSDTSDLLLGCGGSGTTADSDVRVADVFKVVP